jgi:hypothetical protein
MHRPRDDYFSLVFQISTKRSPRNPLGRNATYARRAHPLHLPAPNRILAERRAHISGTDSQYVDAILLQFYPSSFTHGIESKLGRTVGRAEWQRNVPRNAGNIDDRSAALLAHDRDYGLHRRHRAEEIRFEQFVTGGHFQLRNRVKQSVASIVGPHIDALEMMQSKGEDAIDLF